MHVVGLVLLVVVVRVGVVGEVPVVPSVPMTKTCWVVLVEERRSSLGRQTPRLIFLGAPRPPGNPPAGVLGGGSPPTGGLGGGSPSGIRRGVWGAATPQGAMERRSHPKWPKRQTAWLSFGKRFFNLLGGPLGGLPHPRPYSCGLPPDHLVDLPRAPALFWGFASPGPPPKKDPDDPCEMFKFDRPLHVTMSIFWHVAKYSPPLAIELVPPFPCPPSEGRAVAG